MGCIGLLPMTYTQRDFENDCWDWYRKVTAKFNDIPSLRIDIEFSDGTEGSLEGWDAVDFFECTPYTPKQIQWFKKAVEIYRKNPIKF